MAGRWSTVVAAVAASTLATVGLVPALAPTAAAADRTATLVGSLQSELGCSGDWQPDCLRTWLEDPDGDGIYTFETRAIPPGSYETRM